MWIMILAMALSLGVQYYGGQYLDYYAFNQGCDSNACRGVAGVYRISLCTALFFTINGIASHIEPRLHDSNWGGKFSGWVFLLLISLFVPNPLFFGYVWLARVGSFAFVILQQVLLIDLAYYINDTLVTQADENGANGPLAILLGLSFLCFGLSIAGIALLFVFFGTHCEAPNIILSLTVVLIVLAVTGQLFLSQDSNLLTSSVVSLYATYLAAAALAANPVQSCNPFYSNSSDWLSILLGLAFTILALCYTIYSASANVAYLKSGRADGKRTADNAPGGAMMNRILTGQIPDAYGTEQPQVSPESQEAEEEPPKSRSEVSSFNIVMALMAMNVAMNLTNWGSTERSGGDASSPQAGKVAMWMQAASQWTAMSLYIWTCAAPALFPDRDFS